MTPPRATRIKCTQCGKMFDSFSGGKTCSEKCKAARKRHHNAHKNLCTKVGLPAKCLHCGNDYTTTGTTQKYCSDKCARRARTLMGTDSIKNIPAVCIICGSDFLTSNNSRAKTCGRSCADIMRDHTRAAKEGKSMPTASLYKDIDPFASLDFGDYPWSSPIMDPMTSHAPLAVRVEIRDIKECAA